MSCPRPHSPASTYSPPSVLCHSILWPPCPVVIVWLPCVNAVRPCCTGPDRSLPWCITLFPCKKFSSRKLTLLEYDGTGNLYSYIPTYAKSCRERGLAQVIVEYKPCQDRQATFLYRYSEYPYVDNSYRESALTVLGIHTGLVLYGN